jgi:hypothetical protein
MVRKVLWIVALVVISTVVGRGALAWQDSWAAQPGNTTYGADIVTRLDATHVQVTMPDGSLRTVTHNGPQFHQEYQDVDSVGVYWNPDLGWVTLFPELPAAAALMRVSFWGFWIGVLLVLLIPARFLWFPPRRPTVADQTNASAAESTWPY